MQACLIATFFIPIFSFVTIKILLDSEGLFYFLPNLIVRIITLGKFEVTEDWQSNYFHFIVEAYLTCPKCLSGIISLVFYLIYFWSPELSHILEAFMFTILVIFLTYNLERIYE